LAIPISRWKDKNNRDNPTGKRVPARYLLRDLMEEEQLEVEDRALQGKQHLWDLGQDARPLNSVIIAPGDSAPALPEAGILKEEIMLNPALNLHQYQSRAF